MSPKPDVSEERKHQIMSAAEQVFTDKGFDEARMEDIAEETGLSKGTLYLYFKSKDELIIAILDRLFQREFNVLETLDLSETCATDAMWKMVDQAAGDIKIMFRFIPITFEFMGMAFRNKLVQQAFKRYFNRYMEVLVPVIQHGIDTGEFRKVDAYEAAIAASAVMEGTILLWVYDKTKVDPERHIRSGIKLLLEGLQLR